MAIPNSLNAFFTSALNRIQGISSLIQMLDRHDINVPLDIPRPNIDVHSIC